MGDTLQSLQRRKQTAGDLASVVKTMKAMAASNIGHYETAVHSLSDYYQTVLLALKACFTKQKFVIAPANHLQRKEQRITAIVFGSDQGLVGNFNDSISLYVRQILNDVPGNKRIWVVGERVYPGLEDAGFEITKLFAAPNSITAITSLVSEIIMDAEKSREQKQLDALYIFHNKPFTAEICRPRFECLLPLDSRWQNEILKVEWPTRNPPQVIDTFETILPGLVTEYLFVSIYKACAESLASENAERLQAMRRAEKNIDEMSETLKQSYNRLRQGTIDEELFDVISGFEALMNQNQ